MLPVAVYLNKWPLEGMCKEYDVIRRVHLNRGDSLVHIWISEVLQVITSSLFIKTKEIYALQDLQNLQTLIIWISR